MPFTPGTVAGQRNLQRGVYRFGTGVRKKAAGKTLWCYFGQLCGQLECLLVACLKAHCKIQGGHLLLDCFNNFWVAMPQAAGPQAGKCVINFSAIRCLVIMAAGSGNDSWILFEITVCGERHPVGFKRRGIDTHLWFPCILNQLVSIILDIISIILRNLT